MKLIRIVRALLAVATVGVAPPVAAVTPAEDIAAIIMLRGHPCGGAVVKMKEVVSENGTRTITATCPNKSKYQIDVSAKGKVTVTPL